MTLNLEELSIQDMALFPLSATDYPSTYLTAVMLADSITVLKPYDIEFLKDLNDPIAHDFYVKKENPNGDAFWRVNAPLVDIGLVRAFQSIIDVPALMATNVRPEDFPELQRDFVDHEIVPEGMAAPWYAVGFHEFFEFLEKRQIALMLSRQERMADDFRTYDELDASVAPVDVAAILAECVPVVRVDKPTDKLANALLRVRTMLGSDRGTYLGFLKNSLLALAAAQGGDSGVDFGATRGSIKLVRSFKALCTRACADANLDVTFVPLHESVIIGKGRFGPLHLVVPAEFAPDLWVQCAAGQDDRNVN